MNQPNFCYASTPYPYDSTPLGKIIEVEFQEQLLVASSKLQTQTFLMWKLKLKLSLYIPETSFTIS